MRLLPDNEDEVHPAFSDYSGLFVIVKLARLNSLVTLTLPETMQLAYKLRRKRSALWLPKLVPDVLTHTHTPDALPTPPTPIHHAGS